MQQSILDSYRLPSRMFKTMKRTIHDRELRLTVEIRRHRARCPDCKQESSSQYDTRAAFSVIQFEIWYGHPILLEVRKRRFICANTTCERRLFTEVIPGIQTLYRRSTIHFEKQCLDECRSRPFLEVRAHAHVSHTFLTTILKRHVSASASVINWNKEFPIGAENILGLDEHAMKKRKLANTITNISHGKLLAILPDLSNHTLETFFGGIPSDVRARICYVAMDLTNRFPKLVQKYFPKAQIVADHFHVIQLANHLISKERQVIEGLDRVHKKEVKHWRLLLKRKENLTTEQKQTVCRLLSNQACGKLKRAYELKERIRVIMRMPNREEAVQQFLTLTRSDVWNRNNILREELIKYSSYYRTFIETMQKRVTDISAFIRTRITNAFTEGVHTKIKLLKRMSYGIRNTTTYVLRMLLAFQPPFFTHHF